ncbi:MAG: PQQ-binding-like beta-propeller repeat protein [Bacteroidales bacterium]|nr:PQQ-binding-like beta-propeller repeat protein [Bacteroidales bacterium]
MNAISDEKNVPVSWDESTGILWKVKAFGKGWSSPVVYGNQVWITSETGEGKEMYALCFDFNSGKELFRIKLFEPDKVFSKHDINTYATPTPCIEDGFAYFHFGTYGTACVRANDGAVIWKRTDLNCNHVQGPGSSPIIWKNMLILHLEGTDVQFITALDKKTGKTIWKTERPEEIMGKLSGIGRKAYITPIVINVNGADLLISNGSAVCIAYDVYTGKEVWRVVQGEDSTIAMPFSENGVVYFFTSFVTPPGEEQYCELFAVNPEGTGDITSTNVIWRLKFPVLQLQTPVIKDGLIYLVDTRNNLQCIDAGTGSIFYTRRLQDKYNSSPVYAGGKVFFTSVNGETLVLKEGRELNILSRNKLPGQVYATPAILKNSIILRTSEYLFRIGTK